jgi:hypothetical protein
MLASLSTFFASSHLHMFLWGFGGSAAVEVLRVVIAFERGKIPQRYKRPGFWFVRLLLGFFAGLLVIAYGIESKILAMHIGAATPAIIQNFAAKAPVVESGTHE